jgi:hypothetical protein
MLVLMTIDHRRLRKPMVDAQWSMVDGQWSMVNGQKGNPQWSKFRTPSSECRQARNSF